VLNDTLNLCIKELKNFVSITLGEFHLQFNVVLVVLVYFLDNLLSILFKEVVAVPTIL